MRDAGGEVCAQRVSKPDQGTWRAMIPALGIQESDQQVKNSAATSFFGTTVRFPKGGIHSNPVACEWSSSLRSATWTGP